MSALWALNSVLWAANGLMWTFVAHSPFMSIVCWGACLAAIFLVRQKGYA